MADAQLQVVIKARNDAKATFDSVNKQVGQMQGKTGFGGLNDKLGAADAKFKSLTGMSLGFATAAGLAGAAVSGLVKFMSDSVNGMVEYATQIDNTARLLGLSTEETSRLVQASDDLFISQETLTSGLQAATRKGIDVSIDGLKRLADEYLALPEGVERSKFVLDTFGRSGAEMGKLMEVGADGIDAATAAIADNLIVTERSMQDTMNYKRSVDNLNDSWTGFKNTIGQAVIPMLDHLLRQLTKGKDEVEIYQDKVAELNGRLANLNKYGAQAGLSQEELAAQTAAVQAEIEKLNTEFYATQDAADAAQRAIEDLTNAGADYYKDFQSIAKEEENYNKNLGDIRANIRELTAEKDTLIYKYGAESKQVADITAEIHAQGLAAQKLAEEHEKATDRIILGFIEQQLAVDGLSQEEAAFLIDMGVKWGVYEEDMVTAYKNATTEVDNFIRMQGNIDTQQNVDINVTLSGAGASYLANGWTSAKINKNIEGERAAGGPVRSNAPYLVGEAGPEVFVPNSNGNIVPNNRLGGSVINFYYSPALSLSDKAEAEMRIKPMLRQILRGG